MIRLLLFALIAGTIHAQTSNDPFTAAPQDDPPPRAPDRPTAAPKPVRPSAAPKVPGTIPFIDPGSEIMAWDGSNWNVGNGRIFEARLVKYLNAPSKDPQSEREYQELLEAAMAKLAPGSQEPNGVDHANALLLKASRFEQDARLSEVVVAQVFAARAAQKNNTALLAANRNLDAERARIHLNMKTALQNMPMPVAEGGAVGEEWQKQLDLRREAEMRPFVTRLAALDAELQANSLKRDTSELQMRVEFQALIVQLFLQRRFQHVLMGTRLYRALFGEADSELLIGEEMKGMFSTMSGLSPTLGSMDSLANEILSDVREGAHSVAFLQENRELVSASRRLAEVFFVGEHLAEIRLMDRNVRRKIYVFLQKAQQLDREIEVKGFSQAETLLAEIEDIATDFDGAKASAAVITARTLADLHLANGRLAASRNDWRTAEAELTAAAGIWPRNPALEKASRELFSRADVGLRTVTEFEELLRQKNYRRIFDDQMRIIAATASLPVKQRELAGVLDEVENLDRVIVWAGEQEKRGNYCGAWESVERAARGSRADAKLDGMRAALAARAAFFVKALRDAEELERRGQPGSSLARYLEARDHYPASAFASEGIARLVRQLAPDAALETRPSGDSFLGRNDDSP